MPGRKPAPSTTQSTWIGPNWSAKSRKLTDINCRARRRSGGSAALLTANTKTRNRTMEKRIIELLHRNLQEVFGEGDAAAAAPPFGTCILKTACCTSRPVPLLDTMLWTSLPESCARHIHTSSIRTMASHKPCITREFWHGAQARKASPPTIPDWMSSLCATARSPRSTSFSIRNWHSGYGICECPDERDGIITFDFHCQTVRWVVLAHSPQADSQSAPFARGCQRRCGESVRAKAARAIVRRFRPGKRLWIYLDARGSLSRLPAPWPAQTMTVDGAR